MMGSLAFFFFSRIELVVAFLAAAGVFHVVSLRELWGVLRRSEEHASPPDAHNFRLVRLFVTVHWSVYLGPRLFLMAGWIDNITEELCYLTLDAIDKVTMRQRPPAALGGSPIPPRPPRPPARALVLCVWGLRSLAASLLVITARPPPPSRFESFALQNNARSCLPVSPAVVLDFGGTVGGRSRSRASATSSRSRCSSRA